MNVSKDFFLALILTMNLDETCLSRVGLGRAESRTRAFY
jgi:hypothetical protein